MEAIFGSVAPSLALPAERERWKLFDRLRRDGGKRFPASESFRGNLVSDYWARQQLIPPVQAIRDAIRLCGKYPDDLTLDDRGFLASLDEFHCLNDDATFELARLAGLHRGAYVLDVGCGLGGPSRRLAAEYGCEVLAVDITRPFLEIAAGLTERTALSRRIRFVHGDAVNYHFPQRCFDFVWMQVAAANISSRERLYRNLFTALRPGGRLALYDIFEGPTSGLHYPVPWSFDGTTSALLTERETVALCEQAGFKHVVGRVETRALAWFEAEWRRSAALAGSRRGTLGFEILLPRWSAMCASQILNLTEDRIRFGYMVFEKS